MSLEEFVLKVAIVCVFVYSLSYCVMQDIKNWPEPAPVSSDTSGEG